MTKMTIMGVSLDCPITSSNIAASKHQVLVVLDTECWIRLTTVQVSSKLGERKSCEDHMIRRGTPNVITYFILTD